MSSLTRIIVCGARGSNRVNIARALSRKHNATIHMCSPLQTPPDEESSWIFITDEIGKVPPDLLNVASIVCAGGGPCRECPTAF